MKAKIIGLYHTVIPYTINGKRRYIIENIPKTTNRSIVNSAIRATNSREWTTVYNWIDSWYQIDDTNTSLINTIESMTH